MIGSTNFYLTDYLMLWSEGLLMNIREKLKGQ